MAQPQSQDADAIAVVILNWNNWRLSLECIASLRRSVDTDWHAYLVDNASTDGSLAHFVGMDPRVTVIAATTNGGWTGGNNLGVERALSDGFAFIFVLNNDAVVRPDTLAQLRRVSRQQPVPSVIGPIQLSGDASYIDFLGARLDTRTGIPINIGAHEVDFASYPDVYPTTYIRGAAIFAQRIHFEQTGLFDDRFYLNYDESDWCFRARDAGFPLLMTKSAEILHIGSASIGGARSPLNIYFLTRNALLFSEQHATIMQRLYFARSLLRQLMNDQPYGGSRRRLLLLLLSKNIVAQASRAGIRDYLLRRFGDCPPAIRTLGKR